MKTESRKKVGKNVGKNVAKKVEKKVGKRKSNTLLSKSNAIQVRTQGGARAPPPPPGKNVPLRNVQKRRESSAKICRQKRMCTFRLDTRKLKRKRLGKKKKRVKGKV